MMQEERVPAIIEEPLVPCETCGRTFRNSIVERHQTVCYRSQTKKRDPFQSSKQRLSGTTPSQTEAVADKSSSEIILNLDEDELKARRNNWRIRHLNFQRTIKSAKAYKLAMDKGLAPPPPPPPSYDPSFIQCPTCMRRFNEKSAIRHIKFCKERYEKQQDALRNCRKPKQPPQAKVTRKPTTDSGDSGRSTPTASGSSSNVKPIKNHGDLSRHQSNPLPAISQTYVSSVTDVVTDRSTGNTPLMHLYNESQSVQHAEVTCSSPRQRQGREIQQSVNQQALLASPMIQRKQISSPEVQRVQNSNHEVQRKQIASPEIRRVQIASPEVQRKLTATPEIRRVQITSLEVEPKLTATPEIRRLPIASPELQRIQTASPEIRHVQMSNPEVQPWQTQNPQQFQLAETFSVPGSPRIQLQGHHQPLDQSVTPFNTCSNSPGQQSSRQFRTQIQLQTQPDAQALTPFQPALMSMNSNQSTVQYQLPQTGDSSNLAMNFPSSQYLTVYPAEGHPRYSMLPSDAQGQLTPISMNPNPQLTNYPDTQEQHHRSNVQCYPVISHENGSVSFIQVPAVMQAQNYYAENQLNAQVTESRNLQYKSNEQQQSYADLANDCIAHYGNAKTPGISIKETVSNLSNPEENPNKCSNPGAKFCHDCGSRFYPQTSKFCSQCGTPRMWLR